MQLLAVKYQIKMTIRHCVQFQTMNKNLISSRKTDNLTEHLFFLHSMRHVPFVALLFLCPMSHMQFPAVYMSVVVGFSFVPPYD